jgi:hypothetical protein
MKIRNFAHKGLKRLYTENSSKGVPPDTVDKLRKRLPHQGQDQAGECGDSRDSLVCPLASPCTGA